MDAPTSTGPARHVRPRRSVGPVGRAVALVLTGAVAFALVGVGATYLRLQGNIETGDVEALLGEDRPTRDPDPDDEFDGKDLNILVMGTDIRDEENVAIGGAADGVGSDTSFLLHISGDRSRVEVVSIPRDTLLPIPECTHTDGSVSPSYASSSFNSAFALGAGADEDLTSAAACSRRTFEKATGVVTDEHVVVKMDGVVKIIDALGGIPMCLPEPMVSSDAGLSIGAGDQVLDGTTAIAFLRARKGSGFGLDAGSDLARIERQQYFMSAVLEEVQGDALLGDPGRLVAVLDEVTKSLAVSPGLASLPSLAGLGYSLRGLQPSALVTVTVPNVTAPTNRNRVVWTSEADVLWERISADEPIVQEPEPAPEAPGADGEVPAPQEPAAPEAPVEEPAPATEQPAAETPLCG
ncbi:LCP family protein [Sanguibacter suaedae]|uniref:LCP family protein n=1 Tax=Sanguibacter suaedae TaxID=2795737 RepID=A0A934MAU8_9MICO|nr:LCP family protein [Sanguibacter suaedae]MBI9115990.1 LCP family protein [Sanguibacter suaedae]